MNHHTQMKRLALAATISLAAATTGRAQVAPTDSSGLAHTALDLANDLRTHTTMHDWLRLHPRNRVEWNRAHSDGSFNDRWCAVLHGTASTQQWDAYFYVPPPPSILSLPVAAPDLREECLLGAVRLEGAWADSLHAMRAWHADRTELTRDLGSPSSADMWPWATPPAWAQHAMWQRSQITFATTMDSRRADSVREFAPVIAISTPVIDDDDGLFPPPLGQPPIDSLVALAGLRGAEARVIGEYVKLALDTDTVVATVDSARDRRFVESLRQLVRPVPAVPPDQRIGRLLVADWLIDSTSARVIFWSSDSLVRNAISALGPTFDDNHMDGWVQSRFFLTEALAVGGNGPAANIAFVDAMDRGFDFAAECGRGHQVEDVIERGTAFLSSHPNSPVRGQVELMLAEGYRDAVLLAMGGGYDSEGEPDPQFAAVRDQYRQQAITHYRNGFQLIGNSARARSDWQDAWRMIAGIAPLSTHFYCVDD